MGKNIYTILIGMIGLLVLLASCQDDQLLNSSDATITGDNTLTASEKVGVDDGGVAGVFIDDVSNIEVTNFPFSIDISGYVGYFSDLQANNPRLKRLQLMVDNEEVANVERNGQGDPSVTLSDRDDNPGQEFSNFLGEETLTLDITQEGTYTITAKAWFTTHQQDDTVDTENSYDGLEEFEVIEITEETDLTFEFPAAPAIASRILKANDIAPRYGQGRNGGNYIADVAQHMGPGTDFNGESKGSNGDTEMNQAYWVAVWDFLRDATDEDLENAPEGYNF